MHEALTKAAEKLETVAGMTGVVDADIEAMSERVRALLAGRYTMQSERLIHQIFADCFSAEQESVSLEASAADCDIDDLLF
jgi:hypothetical protein